MIMLSGTFRLLFHEDGSAETFMLFDDGFAPSRYTEVYAVIPADLVASEAEAMAKRMVEL